MKQEIDPTLNIQRINTTEWERLRKIRLAALKDAPDAFGSTFEGAATLSKESWKEQIDTLPTFVAVLRGSDSGIVRCAPRPGQMAAADLISMWVAPDARGVGISSALIDTVINWSRSEGYARLLLDVSEHNNFAISLYEREGFRATGITSRFPLPRQHIQEYEMAIDL